MARRDDSVLIPVSELTTFTVTCPKCHVSLTLGTRSEPEDALGEVCPACRGALTGLQTMRRAIFNLLELAKQGGMNCEFRVQLVDEEPEAARPDGSHRQLSTAGI